MKSINTMYMDLKPNKTPIRFRCNGSDVYEKWFKTSENIFVGAVVNYNEATYKVEMRII